MQMTEQSLLKKVRPIPAESLIGDKIQPGNRLFGIVWINPERVSGTPCFFGTRVPIQALFDCLAAGETLGQFLEDFEGVDREQALAVLDLAASGLLHDLEKT
jgi:uncharacterized protein (DUF433 family)